MDELFVSEPLESDQTADGSVGDRTREWASEKKNVLENLVKEKVLFFHGKLEEPRRPVIPSGMTWPRQVNLLLDMT